MIRQDTKGDAIKAALRPLCEKHPSIGIVYLFGSQAKGETHKGSDYDFAVYFDEPDVVKRHSTLFLLAGEISKLLDSDAIDIHSLNDLYAPELKYQIIAEGKVLFEREPYRLIIEPRILNEYFDFMYLLKKYNLTKAAL